MESNKFFNLLTQAIELPFEVEDVSDISEGAGTIYIDLDDGRCFYLTIKECEQ